MKNLLIALLLLAFSTAYSQEDKKVYAFKTEEDIYEGNSVLIGEHLENYIHVLVVRDENGKKIRYKPKKFPYVGFVYDDILFMKKDKYFMGMVLGGPLFLFSSEVSRSEEGVTYTVDIITHFSDGLLGEEFYVAKYKRCKSGLVNYMKEKHPDIAERLENVPNKELSRTKFTEYVKEYNARFSEDMGE